MSATLKDTLSTYNVTELKKMVSAYNKKVKIGPYSKMKKAELINLMSSDKHRAAFASVKAKGSGAAEAPKQVKVVRKTKDGKVVGGSVDGKEVKSGFKFVPKEDKPEPKEDKPKRKIDPKIQKEADEANAQNQRIKNFREQIKKIKDKKERDDLAQRLNAIFEGFKSKKFKTRKVKQLLDALESKVSSAA